MQTKCLGPRSIEARPRPYFRAADGRSNAGALLPKPPTIGETLAKLYHERGVPGLFRGVTPRAIQAAWQTLWMVAIPNMLGV